MLTTRSPLEARHAALGCNAYCRGDRHAHVMWASWTDGDDEDRQELREMCDDMGVRFVSASLAPEAIPLTGPMWLAVPGVGVSGVYLQGGERAWLLLYEVAR